MGRPSLAPGTHDDSLQSHASSDSSLVACVTHPQALLLRDLRDVIRKTECCLMLHCILLLLVVGCTARRKKVADLSAC